MTDHDPLHRIRSEQPSQAQAPDGPSGAGPFWVPVRGLRKHWLHVVLYVGLALASLGVFVHSDRSGSYFNDSDIVQGNTITMGDPLPTPILALTATPTALPAGGPAIDGVEDAPTPRPQNTPQPTAAPPAGCQMDDPALCEPHEPAPGATIVPHDPPGGNPTAEPPPPTEAPPTEAPPATAPPDNGGQIEPPGDDTSGSGGVISIGEGGPQMDADS